MMKSLFQTLLLSGASAVDLSALCTPSIITASLPSSDFYGVRKLQFGPVTANAVYNQTISAQNGILGATGRDYCNVTINYSHTGKNDSINVWYALPSTSQFRNRFLATGGGGLAINSGSQGLSVGLAYGAASGLTDGGFGGFNNDLTAVILKGNGSLNYDAITNFGYLSIHEMTQLGKYLTQSWYTTASSSNNSSNSSKIYSYYQGCSEGGREGWSQIQRYASQFDGVVTGAPAFRQSFQQPLHLFPQIFEIVNGYAPSNCELQKIYNDTLAACDGLDGRVDGVIARSELCKATYDLGNSVGQSYSCAATVEGESGGGMGGGMGGFTGSNSTSSSGISSSGGSTTPATNGTVTTEAVAVFSALVFGPYDSSNRHLYIGFQLGSDIPSLGAGTYNTSTGSYQTSSASGIGLQWVNYFLEETTSSTLDLSSVDLDTLREWMLWGMQKYYSTLETVWTDLENFRGEGGKVLHYHGEADPSIPTGSSVLYWEQVRRTMFENTVKSGNSSASNNSTTTMTTSSYNDTLASMASFYQLYLVPAGVHCSPGSGANDTWPTDTLGAMIEWVEQGVQPIRLNASVVGNGNRQGDREDLCMFPLRPEYSAVAPGNVTADSNGGVSCVFPAEDALEAWFPSLNSVPLDVYGWGL